MGAIAREAPAAWRCERPRSVRRRSMLVLRVFAVALACALVAGLGLRVEPAFAATYNVWGAQTSGSTQTLYGVSFVSQSTGWAVGAAGTILHTTNGGTTWTAQTSNTTQQLNGVTFVDANNGWAVGAAGVVDHTTNGGTTWTAQTVGSTSYSFYGVALVNATTGWVVGSGGYIYYTSNGTTWAAQTSGTTNTLRAVTAASATTAWVVGSAGTVRFTVSGGTLWSTPTSVPSTTTTLYGVNFVDTSNGWATGSGGASWHTTNGGTSWTAQTAASQQLNGAAFISANNGWEVGNRGTIRYTSNGGTNWSTQTSGSTQALQAIASSNSELWATGAAGTILTYLIDITPPTTTAAGLQTSATSGWITGSQLVTLTGSDALSGVKATYYTLDGGATQTYTTGFTVSGQKSHVVTYWSVDNAGNTEGTHTGYVNIDSTAPSTSATNLQTSATTGWVTAGQLVTLTGSDALSGVKATYYTLDGGSRQTYLTPFTVSGDRSHTVTYWSVDNAGNTESTNTGYVNIDTTAPSTSATNLQSSATTGWVNSGQTVTLNVSDALSGVKATYYTLDGSGTKTYTTPFPVSGQASHTVTYWSVDNAGNTESTNTGYVNIDTTAPSTSATNLQSSATTGWVNSGQTVTLNVSDALSGVKATYYTLDGSGTKTYTTPFPVSGQASHTVTYWSVDNAGNTESTNTGYVNIDTTAPTVTDNADSSWHKIAVTVTLTAADSGGSNLAGTYYKVQGASTWTLASGGSFTVQAPPDGSGDGSHTYQYYAVDAAGNSSAIGSCTVWIDTTAPSTSATNLQTSDSTGWVNTGQTVTLNASDALSGPKSIYYTLDGSGTQTYSVPFGVSGAGHHYITYWSVDNAGNTEGTHTGYVNIDSTAPSTSATNLQTSATTGWVTAGQLVTLTGSDALSGVKATYYTLDGGSRQTYLTPFTVSGDRSHTVTYWSVDNAGNTESTNTGYVNIDTTAPSTSATNLQSSATTGWVNSGQTVTLNVSDALSGVKATYYTLDGSGTKTYTTPFPVSGQASHTVTYWSVDNAGNTESTNTGYVNIDTTAPTVTDNADSSWHKIAVTVTLTAADSGGSNLAGTYYKVQGASTWTLASGGSFTVQAPPDGSGDGSHTYQYYAVDTAGNSSAIGSCTVWIDTTAPTTLASGLQPDSHTGWRSTSQLVSLSATDGGSGTTGGSAATYYTLDGSSAQTYSGPFTVSGTDQHYITYWSVDNVGNVESTHTGWVNISNPYVQATGLANDAYSNWQNGSGPVTLNASGVNPPLTIHYTAGAGWVLVGADSTSFPVAGDGSHEVDYYVTDSSSAQSPLQTGYVNIDLVAPTTTATNLQTDGSTGWSIASVVVTLSASDGESGVAATYYTVDNGPKTTYQGPFVVSSDGSHAISYWSVDNVGNAENPHAGWVNIDTTAPTVIDNAGSSWHNSDATVQLAATDPDSGVQSVSYRPAGTSSWTTTTGKTAQFTVSAPADGSNDGVHTYEYRATDNVGNTSATKTCTVRVDTQGPTVSSDADAYWHNSAVTVNLTATDPGSGVQSVSYRPTGTTSWTTTTGTTAQIAVPAPADGQAHSYSFDYTATDKCGNVSAVQTLVVLMDPRMPNTTISGLPTTTWTNKPVSLTFTATPGDGAPIVRTEYSTDGGSTWTTWTAGTPLVISTPGTTALLYRSVNAAGAVENPARQATVHIDVGKPTCVAVKNVTVKHGKTAKLSYKVTDPAPSCGSAKVTISISLKKKVVKKLTFSAATNKTLVKSFKVKLKPGTYRWTVTATDIAGNSQAKSGNKSLKIR